MPAMSPTMTEGGISSWKKAEGDSFAAGDVLLEIVRPSSLLPHCQRILTLADARIPNGMLGNRQGCHRR